MKNVTFTQRKPNQPDLFWLSSVSESCKLIGHGPVGGQLWYFSISPPVEQWHHDHAVTVILTCNQAAQNQVSRSSLDLHPQPCSSTLHLLLSNWQPAMSAPLHLPKASTWSLQYISVPWLQWHLDHRLWLPLLPPYELSASYFCRPTYILFGKNLMCWYHLIKS